MRYRYHWLFKLLALVLAAWGARYITDPLRRIDLQNPDDRQVYEELQPLVQRISGQNRQIQQKVDELKEGWAEAVRRTLTGK